MPMLDVVHAMTDYNYTFFRRVWESIMTLSDEQFITDVPYSHGSIRNHMVHLATVDTRWLRGLQESPEARSFRLNPADYPTREIARAVWEQAAGEVAAYVAGLDEAALEHTVPGMPMATWQVLLHVANHGTDHRAQVLRALHDFGAPTFDQDVAYYFMR